ncbi:MAG TPA: hypothetical protein VGC22_06275 [Chitinophaga sp.]
MKRMTHTILALGLCCSLGVMAAACGGNRSNSTTTDSTGVATDSLMSNTNASGNASPAALPGDTTRSDSMMPADSSTGRR